MSSETPPDPEHFPQHAYVKGYGRVRVLSYDGNGTFTILTSRDERVMLPRWRLSFRK